MRIPTSMPTVACGSAWNSLRVKRVMRLVLPTPLSPAINCKRIDEYGERKGFPRELLHVKTFGKFIMAFLMFEGRTWRESIDPRSQRASNCSPASPGLLLGVREKWLRGGRFSEACRI